MSESHREDREEHEVAQHDDVAEHDDSEDDVGGVVTLAEAEGVSAEAMESRLERDARARRGLCEDHRERLSVEGLVVVCVCWFDGLFDRLCEVEYVS